MLDYVSMRLLSPTQFIWRPSVPQFSSSGTHRINTRSNVTVPDVVYSITRSQLCFNWVLDYVSMRLLSLIQFIWRPSVPQFSSSGTHRINTRVMSLYLMSVYSITRSQLCFNWVLDYVSMRLLSPTQFIWRPSVPQFSSSGTHRINTRSNVTVPDVSVFHHKKSIVFQLGADYVSMRLLSPTQFIWRPSVLQLCCSGTHRINTRRNVTVPDVSVFHHKESIVLRLDAWIM